MRKNKKNYLTWGMIITAILSIIGVAAKDTFTPLLTEIFNMTLLPIKNIILPPPETFIASAIDKNNISLIESKVTTDSKIKINFEGSSRFGISYFECSIDDYHENFKSCKSPHYQPLTIGEHVFYVRAIDTRNNIDPTPASFTIEIKESPPQTKIIRVEDDKGITVGNNTNTTSNNKINFHFVGLDNEKIRSYICSLDNEIIPNCDSPKKFSNLELGRYTFKVIAIDDQEIKSKPEKWNINIISSGNVVGKVEKNRGQPYPFVNVVIDQKYKDDTNALGKFAIPKVPNHDKDIKHHLAIVDEFKTTLTGDEFFFYPYEQEKDLKTIIVDENVIDENLNINDKSNINPFFKPEKSIIIKPIDLVYDDKKIRSANSSEPLWNITVKIIGPQKILKQIKYVTYFLHPSFKPAVTTKDDFKNNFALNMTAYGGFKLYAKVSFDDKKVVDLSRFILLK